MRTLQSLGVVSSFAIASVATAQNAVQWRVEDGGNGHWYAAMVLPGAGLNWENARTFAQSRGADLASLETALESAFAGPLVNTSQFSGAWIGLYQPGSACEPDCGWTWVSGASLSDQNWSQGEPNNLGGGFGDEDHGLMAGTGWGCGSACWGKWVDWPGTTTLKAPIALVEWSADCNSDGIVDFGQIISGELADLDANNIPDCCEGGISCNCVGDTNNDHRVDGADIAFILAGWGQSAAKFPNADCNHDGLIDGADLALVLGSWGACP